MEQGRASSGRAPEMEGRVAAGRGSRRARAAGAGAARGRLCVAILQVPLRSALQVNASRAPGPLQSVGPASQVEQSSTPCGG